MNSRFFTLFEWPEKVLNRFHSTRHSLSGSVLLETIHTRVTPKLEVSTPKNALFPEPSTGGLRAYLASRGRRCGFILHRIRGTPGHWHVDNLQAASCAEKSRHQERRHHGS